MSTDANLFTAFRYQGRVISPGCGRTPSFGAYGYKAISSIHLVPGYAIRVFTGVNFTGHSRTFGGSVINPSPYGWNDMIRSVEIVRL